MLKKDPIWNKRLQAVMWLQRAPPTADGRSLAFNYGKAEEGGVTDAM